MQENSLNGRVRSAAAFTGPPAYARQRLTPSVRKNVLFPAIFEPVIMTTSPNVASVKSLHIFFSTGISGCPNPRELSNGSESPGSSVTSGIVYSGFRWAKFASEHNASSSYHVSNHSGKRVAIWSLYWRRRYAQ